MKSRLVSALIGKTRLPQTLAVAGLALATLVAARAQTPPQNTSDPAQVRALLPTGDGVTAGDLENKFRRQELTLLGKKELSFEFLIPKNWGNEFSFQNVSAEALRRDSEQAVPLMAIYPSGNDDLYVRFLYIRQPPEVAPAEVLDRMIEHNHWTPVARQALQIKGRAAEDVLVRDHTPDLGPVYRRVTVLRQGGLLFIIVSTVAEDDYEKYKGQVGVLATSFTPLGT